MHLINTNNIKKIGILVLVAFALMSCGKKRQAAKVVYVPGGDGSSTGSLFDGIVAKNLTVVNLVKNVENHVNQNGYKCSSGSRIHYNFRTSRLMSGTSIGAGEVLTPTSALGGAISDFYLGINGSRDLMIVSKMVSASAFNLSILVCPEPPLIASNRRITALKIDHRGITIGDLTSEHIGSVLAANGLMVDIPAYSYYQSATTWLYQFSPLVLQNHNVR